MKKLKILLCIAFLIMSFSRAYAGDVRYVTTYENDFTNGLNKNGTEWTFSANTSISDAAHAVYDSINKRIDISNPATGGAARKAYFTLPNAITSKDTTLSFKYKIGSGHSRLKVRYYDDTTQMKEDYIYLTIDGTYYRDGTHTYNHSTKKTYVGNENLWYQVSINFDFANSKMIFKFYYYDEEGNSYENGSYEETMASGTFTKMSKIEFSNEFAACNVAIDDVSIVEVEQEPNPEAKHVGITGFENGLDVDTLLIGTFDYFNSWGIERGECIYNWYRTLPGVAVNTSTDFIATGETYRITSEDEGKLIWFGITPVSQTGKVGQEQFAYVSMTFMTDLKNDYDELDIGINEDGTSVIENNISLPQTGANGSQITWTSDYSSIINGNGEFISPNEDTVVTLTALLSNTGRTLTKNFEFIAKGYKTFDENGIPVNIALGKKLIAHRGLIYNTPGELEDDGSPYMYLLDGDTETNIRSGFASTLEFTVDLEKVLKINSVNIYENSSLCGKYTILASADNATWTTVCSGNKIGGNITVSFPCGQYRYVKFKVDENLGAGPMIFSEFGVCYVPNKGNVSDILLTGGDNGFRVGDEISASYTYNNINNIPEKSSMYRWLRSENSEFEEYTVVGEQLQYIIQSDDVYNYLRLEITPVSEENMVGEKALSDVSSIIMPTATGNEKPVALFTTVAGECFSGRTLTGTYLYVDTNDYPEGETVIRWLRVSGEDSVVVKEGTKSNEDILNYVTDDNDIGKKIILEITPVNSNKPGDAVTAVTVNEITKDPCELDLQSIVLPGNTSESLVLSIKGKNGSVISWETSNSDVVETNGNVFRKDSDIKVILTATVTYLGRSVKKEFEVTVNRVKDYGSPGGSSGGGSGKKGSISLPNATSVTKEENNIVFDDVDSTHWAATYIYKLASKNIINGTDKNNFQPDRNISREEFVKILVNALKLKANFKPEDNCFTDVDVNSWSYPYIMAAAKANLIVGDNGRFNGLESISRQDMAVIIFRASKLSANVQTGLVDFSYSEEISDYAIDAVKTLSANKIISGRPDGTFGPKETATRAEASKIISNLLELI